MRRYHFGESVKHFAGAMKHLGYGISGLWHDLLHTILWSFKVIKVGLSKPKFPIGTPIPYYGPEGGDGGTSMEHAKKVVGIRAAYGYLPGFTYMLEGHEASETSEGWWHTEGLIEFYVKDKKRGVA